jgi:N,N-dimethylformamidase
MRLVGYSDRLSAAPGETIAFMVSSGHPAYDAEIVRLVHGDPNPRGPGLIEHAVESPVTGTYPGRIQQIHTGSYVMDLRCKAAAASRYRPGSGRRPLARGCKG